MSTPKRAALAAVAVLAAAADAAALEFGMDAIAGNMHFPWEDQVPIAAGPFPDDNYFWGGTAWLRAPLGEDAAVRVSYERDPVLRNSALAAVEFERGIAKISAGPFVGFLNSDSAPFSAGISATVRLQWPGVAYVSMRSDGATAIALFQADVAPQARTEISAGIYVPHAIVSGVVSAKRFNETLDSGDLVTDSLTRYAMEIEIYKKNVPYTLVASLGYEQRSKRFEASGTTHTLGAAVIGLETAARIGPALELKTSFDTGVYLFGLDDLEKRGPAADSLFFNAGLGFSLNLAAIPPRPPKIEAAPATEEPAEQPEAAAEEAQAAEAGAEEQAAAEAPKAAADRSKFGLFAGSGAGYERFIQLPAGNFLVETLLNVRGSAWAGVSYRVAPMISLGAQVGLDYFYFKEEKSGFSLNIADIPLRLVVGLDLGFAKLDAFGGFMPHGIYIPGLSPLICYGIEAGARAGFGLFYLEGSYVFGLSDSISFAESGFDLSLNASYFRFGTGVAFKLK